ncbi:MAG: B12-binding domain-containing radical SAM protein, partial [Deltaproteobacteria bacterium]|nr:B12-binding domain-containing radical SAM protein [Deltaproteobacteria bacterium]
TLFRSLGGPAVSFGDPAEAVAFLAAHPQVDALAFGEGEPVICDLVAALLDGNDLSAIPNLTWRGAKGVAVNPRAPAFRDLDVIPEISPAEVEVARTPGAGVALVYQTYRGCPYTCAYCSFHGGSAGIRRFDAERVEREMKRILDARADIVHFADSVFDLSAERAKRLLRFLNRNNHGTALFFYTTFQNLDDELARLCEESRAQFEVGVQSMHADVLKRVKRHFNVERFRETAQRVKRLRINYYVDLMFGLPGDDMGRFRDTFNQIMALHAPFVMTFPLTVIPRSEMGQDPDGFELVRYDDAIVQEAVHPFSGIVYTNIGLYRGFTLADLSRYESLVTALFYAYQRYPVTLKVLSDYALGTAERGHGIDAFAVFETMGDRIRAQCKAIGFGYTGGDWPLIESTFRDTFLEVLRAMGGSADELEAANALSRLESGVDFLVNRVDRRGHFLAMKAREPRRLEGAPAAVDKETVAFCVPHRLGRLPFRFDDLARLAELQDRIPRKDTDVVALAPYDDWKVDVGEIDPVARVICEEVPEAREMPLKALARRMARRVPDTAWEEALADLVSRGILGVYHPG